MIFDDYRVWMNQHPLSRTKLGVDTFMKFYGREYEVVHDDYQFIIRKISEARLD